MYFEAIEALKAFEVVKSFSTQSKIPELTKLNKSKLSKDHKLTDAFKASKV
jgi:hypothetical protein